MDGQNRGGSIATRWRVIRLASSALVVAIAFSGTGRPASASAIKAESLVVTDINSLGPVWAAFLEEGLARTTTLGHPDWTGLAVPSFPSGLILPKQADGELVVTPFVEYLDWRRALDPVRFDQYHPTVGPQLGLLNPPTTTTNPTSGGTSTGGTNPAQGGITVPEPGSFLTAFVIVASAIGWGRRARTVAARRAGR